MDGRNGYDADFYFKTLDYRGKLLHWTYFYTVDVLGDDSGIGVEGGGDGKVLLFKSVVAEQGAPERTYSDDGSFRGDVPSEGVADRFAKLSCRITAAGLAGDADHSQILA